MNRKNRTTMRHKRRNGGAATVFPLKYFDPSVAEPSANAGRDLLKAIPPIGVRPRIGGRRQTRKTLKNKRKATGGFVPSVMNGFVAATSKYIVPIALFAGYKLMSRKATKKVNKTRRH